ncbi:MAG: hypothetical protein EA380_11980 [Phycisphaeraceae bacterium]|nr:MAG: hypothetical protein EA380_11980 [Phycisphaeraceae bacterium]
MAGVSVVACLSAGLWAASAGLTQVAPVVPHGPPAGGAAGMARLATGLVPLEDRRAWRAGAGGRVLLGIDGALTASRRRALDEAGVVLVQAMGDGVFIADMGGVRRDALAELRFVRGITRYSEAMKVSPDVGFRAYETAERRTLQERGRERLLVHLFADVDAGGLAEALDAMRTIGGLSILHHTEVGGVQTISVEGPEQIIPLLSVLEQVQYIEPAPEGVPRNAVVSWVVQSNVPDSRPLWDAGLTGLNQVIGVTDSGLNTAHCSFSTVPGKVIAYNGDFRVTNHGTHVAATAVGNPGPSGSDSLRGHAFDAGLVFSRIPAFTNSNLTTVLETQAGPGQEATVHSNSWGDDNTKQYSGLSRAVDAFMHEHEEHLVVIASVNGGQIAAPDNAKNSLTVSAASLPPNQESVCFGGRFFTQDGRIKPDVVAPGCGIRSAFGGSSCGDSPLSGTSMATPAVSGMAALVRQYFMEGWYPSGMPTPTDGFVPSGALLKAVLVNSAQDMAGEPGYPNDREGWGRVVVADSLPLGDESRRLIVQDVRNDVGLVTGSVIAHPIQVLNDAEPLKITLAWTDPPASPGAMTALVNDLDLEVIAPNGDVYFGNVFGSGWSITGGEPDRLNNLEQVHIQMPEPGVWMIRIIGANVKQGLQGYALATTGAVSSLPAPATVALSGLPMIVAPESEGEVVEIVVHPGDEEIVAGSARLLVRYRGPNPEVLDLEPMGDGVYRGVLPAVVCGATLEVAAEVIGNQSGVIRTPAGEQYVRVIVDVLEPTVVLEEDFSDGFGAGWLADGLWNVTGACNTEEICEAAPWAYFGNVSTCTYNTGSRAVGSLQSPLLILPLVGPGGRITLEYCSSMENENTAGFDMGLVYAGATVVDEAPHTGGVWERRIVDLTSQQGRALRLNWRFDTIDGQFNDFAGWRVDDIRVVVERGACVDPCPGDINFDGRVDLNDFVRLAGHFQSVVDGMRWQGDLTGDGQVTLADFQILANHFGQICY